ncbi:transporter substrate-binding domain-containing diguanylate cyclase [Raoultibacter phocaeensis]|uniref:transporter substrate-binding domain-containing diguanylate cyclase n=1 Tax=Raoultibacter phocaeensis TaxID=2479841 RepID=UPI0015D650B1|nr:GGDEF domain-containing protein [Raoultibacter phocaeensis]
MPTVQIFGIGAAYAEGSEAASAATNDTAQQATHGSKDLQLTAEERALAFATPPLRVGVLPGREPMSYLDASGQVAGVTRDVLDRIARETGLTFEYVMLESSDALLQQAKDLQLDFIAGCEDVEGASGEFGFALSEPYSITRAVVAFNASYAYSDLSSEMPMAVTFDRVEQYESLGYTVLSYLTAADCLAAVDRGDAVYTYENSHVIPLVLDNGSYSNVLTVDASFQNVNLCFALREPHDEQVLALLDKAIESIPARDVISLVYDHTYSNRTFTFRELISQYPTAFALIVSVPLLVVVAALGFIAFTRSRAASHDPLTQMLNAATFRRKVLSKLRRSEHGAVCCLLILDIDDFKQVNDTYGHFEGDRALKAVSAALKAACGKGEYAARMGGDEFLAYWEEDSLAAIEKRADALLHAVSAHVAEVETIADEVTASVGIASARPGEDYDDLYRRADAALYHGKEGGKGCASIDG